MLVDSEEDDRGPLLIDAMSEWWTIQLLPGRPDSLSVARQLRSGALMTTAGTAVLGP